MIVAYDDEIPPPREHPWTVTMTTPDGRYWDFKAHPEQIPLVLEDFRPWAHYAAIPRFYELLAWLNGPDSILESNDCGLRPPRVDAEAPEMVRGSFTGDPVVVHGRLTVLFRNLAWNAAGPTVDGLKRSIHDGLRDNVPMVPAVVKVGEWAHFFTAIGKEGSAVQLRFWAWGQDEAGAMECLAYTVGALHEGLRWISDGVKNQNK